MTHAVAITGLGMVTPLGDNPGEVLARMAAGESAAAAPSGFDASPFSCPVCAEVSGFDAERRFPDNKTLRLMNRDAQFAVTAARLALADSGLNVGTDCAPEAVALYGSTGLAGMPLADITRLVRNSAGEDGGLDLGRFGSEAIRKVRPVLSFKILANMPICFVSIFEGLRGPNAVFTPWEGQGARAIVMGVRAIHSGRVPCAVVGGCDVKTHAMAFLSLEQQGVFRSWREDSSGPVPGEGAVFVVLESLEHARARGANIYACVSACAARTIDSESRQDAFNDLMRTLGPAKPDVIVAAADGDAAVDACEQRALALCGMSETPAIQPKMRMGNLFAAAAAVQVALGAALCKRSGERVLANCFGHGSEIASFALEGGA